MIRLSELNRKTARVQQRLKDNLIKNCFTGIKTYQSSPEIYNNYIENNYNGVLLATSSSPDIHDNDFYGGAIGIYLDQSQPSEIKWNNFGWSGGDNYENADEGILVAYLQTSNSFLDGQWNNFHDGYVTKDISNPSGTMLYATGNYWSDLTITGQVDVSSPQSSHNDDAGPGGALGKIAVAQSGFVEEQKSVGSLPTSFQLEQNYPNPFNPSTSIGFQLEETSDVTLVLYDILGKEVRTLLFNDFYIAGFHKVTWNGRDENGNGLTSGVYFYRIYAKTEDSGKLNTKSRKLILMR